MRNKGTSDKKSAEEKSETAFRAFTLIELLVVMAIIAILAGLVLRTAGYVQRKAATSRAEAEIAALSAALESYKADYGTYPTGVCGNPTSTGAISGSNFFLRDALQTNASGAKVYFEFPTAMGTNSDRNIQDPFGENYGYAFPHAYSNLAPTNFFLIWSRAGSANTNQWIKNW